MRELSLYTGAGGGLLGTNLLGWQPVGYVEIDDYCQRILAARIADGHLPVAPIFTDVCEFLQSGAAAEYRGVADVVSAGFPCPAYSSAARGRNLAEKDLSDITLEIIRVVKPGWAFLENVVEIRSHLPRIGGELARMGYSLAPVAQVSGASVGAPHERRRVWIVAHANSNPECHIPVNVEVAQPSEAERPSEWQEFDPGTLGVPDGMASRMDRLRALGNGQVPLCAATAWRLLVPAGRAGGGR